MIVEVTTSVKENIRTLLIFGKIDILQIQNL